MQPKPSPRIAIADSRRLTLAICIILLPIISFYAILARRVLNLPFLDDYNGVLEFLEHFSSLPNAWAKAGYVVLAQHNEYKPVFANFMIALQYGISGHPSFILLSWLGNLFVLALFYLMWKYFLVDEENTSRRLLLFAPVAYLLFQLQYAETLNWSSPGLQNIPVLVFAFAAIAVISRNSRSNFLHGLHSDGVFHCFFGQRICPVSRRYRHAASEEGLEPSWTMVFGCRLVRRRLLLSLQFSFFPAGSEWICTALGPLSESNIYSVFHRLSSQRSRPYYS